MINAQNHSNSLPDLRGELNNLHVIEINNLHKSFGDQIVLKDISFNLIQGENLIVLGKSGSGKSVLIKCISGLLPFESGEIKLFGVNIAKCDRKELGEMRQKIGFLFQGGALYDSMTVRQNLEFPLRRLKKFLSSREIDEKVNEALEHVGLTFVHDKMPAQLSGGMCKRVSLARTIVMNPLIMLYDEPTTGLDPVTSNEISLLINEVKKKYKTSSVIISHDINCVRTTADRIIMLKESEVYMVGTLSTFLQSEDQYIKSFFN